VFSGLVWDECVREVMKTNTYDSLGKYVDLLLDAICIVDKDGVFLHVSNGCERVFGYTPEEMIGRRMIEMVHPEDHANTLRVVDRILAGEVIPHFENRYLRKNGEVVHVMWSARWSDEDQCRIAVARDITSRKRAEILQSALYTISEAVHDVEDLHRLFERIHQVISQLLPAQNFTIALYDDERDEVTFPYHANNHFPRPEPQNLQSDTPCAQVIRGGKSLLLESGAVPESSISKDHCYSWLGVPLKSHQLTVGALVVRSYAPNVHYTDQDRELLQFVSAQVATAIERKQMVARLQYLALHDQLTQLPNRALFHDRLQLALARAHRNHEEFSLFYLDLDKFKEINDEFGHSTGDLLLQSVARRLQLCVRDSDTVARFGGDEFVILLENVKYPEQTQQLLHVIQSGFNEPFNLAGQMITIFPSIGIAHFPLHGSNEKQLLHYADDAMYSEKRRK